MTRDMSRVLNVCSSLVLPEKLKENNFSTMEDIKVFQHFLKDIQYLKDFRDLQNLNAVKCNKQKRCTISNVKRKPTRFNPLEQMNEIEFRKKYRYTKENMRRIIEIVRDDLEVDHYEPMKKNQVPVDLQILSAIRFFGGTEVATATPPTIYTYTLPLHLHVFAFSIPNSQQWCTGLVHTLWPK